MPLIAERVREFTPYFFIRHKEGKTYLLLYEPYLPYLPNGKGYVDIDAYYPASNRLYFCTKALGTSLSDIGAKRFDGNLKRLFWETKCGYYMNNTLIAIPPYGTRVCLNALELEGVEFEETEGAKRWMCADCGKCVAACPRGALQRDGFRPEACFRFLLNTPRPHELTGLKGNVTGCDLCQRACPMNPTPVPTPEELRALLRYETFADMIMGGKKGLEPLEPYLGKNYLRPRRLAYLFLNAVEGKGEREMAVLLKDFPDDEVKKYVRELTERV